MKIVDKKMLIDYFDNNEVSNKELCEACEYAMKTREPVFLTENGKLTGKQAILGPRFTVVEK